MAPLGKTHQRQRVMVYGFENDTVEQYDFEGNCASWNL
jgi:hypothetical protein